MLRTAAIALSLTLVALVGCEERKPAAQGSPSPSASAALPAGLFLAAPPDAAKNVKDAKPALKAGDKVVLVGRIGGSEAPFVADRAMFTLVDRRLKSCGEGDPSDSCETPWDFCCEARADITANSATVQVLGPDGRPVKAELNGVRGLKPLALVTVVGTVAEADGENVVVTASGLFVGP